MIPHYDKMKAIYEKIADGPVKVLMFFLNQCFVLTYNIFSIHRIGLFCWYDNIYDQALKAMLSGCKKCCLCLDKIVM
jgi:hypothetical protein